MFSKELINSIKYHEGLRLKAYKDSVGVWTIGYGSNLECLEIDPSTAEEWLYKKLRDTHSVLVSISTFMKLDKIRQEVLLEMGYNLGTAGLLRFKNMWDALENGDYDWAAHHMLQSKWASQVGQRATTLANVMRNGKWTTNSNEADSSNSNSKTKSSLSVWRRWF